MSSGRSPCFGLLRSAVEQLDRETTSNTGTSMTDEFDDLDDYLDDFDAEILAQEPGATIKNTGDGTNASNTQTQGNSGTSADNTGENSTDERAATSQFRADTHNMNSEMEELSRAAGMDPAFSKTLSDFMQQLDPQGDGSELDAILGNSNTSTGVRAESNQDKNENEKDGGFQSTINETMNRLKTSSQQVEEESTKKMNKDEELLTTLLNSLDLGGDDDGGLEGMDELKELLSNMNMDELASGSGGDEPTGESVDKVSNVLLKMLNKLTSKEMMYDTVSTAVTNYEQFFKNSTNKTSANDQDHERYMKQLQHLRNVKSTFDKPDYNEENDEYRDFVDQEMENFNKILPAPPGVVDDNLGQMGLDGTNWNDKDVPQDLEQCVQQ
jgi:peroxin-19